MKEIIINTTDQQTLKVRALGYKEYEISKGEENLGKFHFAELGGYLFHAKIAGLKFQTENKAELLAADDEAMEDILFKRYALLTPAARQEQKNQDFANLNWQLNIALDECLNTREIHETTKKIKARYAAWDARLEK